MEKKKEREVKTDIKSSKDNKVDASPEFIAAANTILAGLETLVNEHQKLKGHLFIDKPEIGHTKTRSMPVRCAVNGCREKADHVFSFINKRFRCCDTHYDKVNEIYLLTNHALLDLQSFFAEEVRRVK